MSTKGYRSSTSHPLFGSDGQLMGHAQVGADGFIHTDGSFERASTHGREGKTTDKKKSRFGRADVMNTFSVIGTALFCVILFEWVSLHLFGVKNALFTAYPDGSGLIYFDVFGYLLNIKNGFGVMTSSFLDTFSAPTLKWNDIGNSILSIYNSLSYFFNLVLLIIKLNVVYPLMAVGTFLGGIFNDGFLGGLYTFLLWRFPYAVIK